MRSEFDELNATIVGVSSDRSDRQLEFDEANQFKFPLLSDPDKSVAKQFGVKRMGPMPTKRATFVIDTDRKIMAVFASEVNMTAHADQALEVLRQRQRT